METVPRIRELDATLLVFFQADLELVENWFGRTALPRDLPVAADANASLYEALGTERASYFRLMNPASLRAGLRSYRAGFRPKATRADMHRLGAELVVDARGEVTLLHRAAAPEDRLSPTALVEELERITA